MKKANPATVKTAAKTVKAKKLKSKKLTIKLITVKNAQGKVKVTKVKKGNLGKALQQNQGEPDYRQNHPQKGQVQEGRLQD